MNRPKSKQAWSPPTSECENSRRKNSWPRGQIRRWLLTGIDTLTLWEASGKYANGWKWDDLIGRCYGVCCGNGPLGVGQMVKNNCSFRNNIKDIVKVYLRFATRDFMVRWLFSWLTAISWLWISLCRGWPTGKKEKMFWVSEMFLMFDWC